MKTFPEIVTHLALLTVAVVMATEQCQYCAPDQQCWPSFQQLVDFNKTLYGYALFPSQPEYSQIVVMYDTRLTRFPYLIAIVESTEDVQKSVLFARDHNMKLSIRGTGHDYIGRSTADMSLQINLSRMRGRKVNLNTTRSDAGEITAEAGNTWIDMYREVEKYNRLVVGGSAHTVGLGGYTFGGGHSPYGRRFGMAVDNLLEVKLVMADGSLVISNAMETTTVFLNGSSENSSNTDLFWALRGGGGGTFGVAVTFTYRLHKAPSQFVIMTCYMPIYYLGQNVGTEYLKTLDMQLATLPPEWGGYQLIGAAPYPTLPGSKGSITLVLNHAGEWGTPSFNAILPFYNKYNQSCSFRNVSTFLEYSNSTDAIYYPAYVANTLVQPDSFTDDYYEFILVNVTLAQSSGCTGTLIGGNMKNMGPDSTAVNPSFRAGVISMTCGFAWSDLNKEDYYVQKGEELAKQLTKYGRGVYFNEPSAYLPDWKQQYWGGHYDKLLTVKQKWDPANIFTCLHCVGSDSSKPTLIDVIVGK